jgi:Obg family GTPase CgtA
MKKRTIRLEGGNGGDGIVSFKRSYKVPRGGPDGGNGGNGGNIYANFLNKTANFDKSIGSLVRAQNGQKGETNNKNGKSGNHTIINVPKNYSLWLILSDKEKKEVKQKNNKPQLLAKGGKGGWGNTKFVLPNRKTPRFSQNGQKGEKTTIEVLPKSNADAVIIGEPNTGKTTLLNTLSGSKAKIGPYPGTTQTTNYGTYEDGKTLLVIADIPEAQINQNDDHLKQAEIVLCVVRSEKNLSHYTNVCAPNQKTITVVTEEQNKTPSVIYGPLDQEATIVSIKEKIKTLSLVASPKKIQTPKKTPIKKTIIKKDKFNVYKLGVKFVLVGSTPNLLAETLDLSNSEARYEFFRRMSLLGVNRGLIKTGARPGDIVLVGGKEVSWEF